MALSDGFFDSTYHVIYNRLGITDQDTLRQAEGEFSLPAMRGRTIVGTENNGSERWPVKLGST